MRCKMLALQGSTRVGVMHGMLSFGTMLLCAAPSEWTAGPGCAGQCSEPGVHKEEWGTGVDCLICRCGPSCPPLLPCSGRRPPGVPLWAIWHSRHWPIGVAVI